MNDPVKVLMEMTDEVVSAKYLAPILHMDPSVIVKYAKDGTWNQERNGGFVISGEGPGAHVKFKRVDFLRKWGFLEPEKEEPTIEQLLMRLIEVHMDTNMLLAKLLDKKTAGAATPTD